MAAIILTVVTIAVILAINRGKIKIPAKLAIAIAALEIIGCAVSLSNGSGNLKISRIQRPEPGESSEEHEIKVRQGEREENLTLDISDRKLTEREAEEALQQAKAQIERDYLGENGSADSVYKDLRLKGRYLGTVEAQWDITPYGVFDSEGKIDSSKAEQPVEVTILGYLECEKVLDEIELHVTAVPVPMDTAEGFLYYIKKAIQEAEERNPTQGEIELPEQIGGESVSFTEKKEDKGIKLVVVMALIPLLYVFYIKQKAKDNEKKWQRELSYDYPKLISQLSLYIGAGFSVKAAFAQTGNSYLARRARGYPQRPAFEEIVRMNRRIRDGEDEESAYKALGESLRHRGFRKLTLLLSQSLRKGGKDLREQLEQEERSAYDERRINAKVAGEEASLKLMLPMMGMLGVIFVILMVPALMQMS